MGNNNSDSNEFTYLFDGQSIDGWRMAGLGKLYLLNTINHCNQKEEWDYYDIQKRSTRILY
ncbi:MAG: hypothetical protein ACJ73C_08825 [Nitrososphaeraceae archaeon]